MYLLIIYQYPYIFVTHSIPFTISFTNESDTSGTITPNNLLFLVTKLLARGFGTYPVSFITSKTLCLTSSVTGFESFITLETVDIETPANFATSFIVTLFFLFFLLILFSVS